MTWLKQSTAADVILGPFVDDTDFKTKETALTISQADIRLSKNGAAFAQTNNAAGATHRENGEYLIPLDTTDTNTLGRLRVSVHEAGALSVWRDFMVVPANVWDSLFGADKLQIDVAEWLGAAAATPTVAGVPEVDVTHFGGTAATAAGGRPEVNTSHISGNADAATILERSARNIARITVGAASTTTSVVSSACTPSGAVADQFKGRILIFDKDTTTAALRGQATDITASSNAATPTFTVTALTTAPASGDTATIQ